MLMTVYILLNHFTAARGEVSMCTLIHICIYIKWIIWQFLMCWMGWGAGQTQRKGQPCTWICLSDGFGAVNDFPGMRCRSWVNPDLFRPDARGSGAPAPSSWQSSWLLCAAQHRSAQIPDCQRWRFHHHTALFQLCWAGLVLPGAQGKDHTKVDFCLAFFSSSKLTECLNVLSGLISVAVKVEVTSCLVQKSASCLYLTAQTASVGCVRPSTQTREWLSLKLGTTNTLCLIPATSLCFPKVSPHPSSTQDAREQQQKAGKNFTWKKHHCKGCADQTLPECWMKLSVLLSGLSDR